MKKEAILRKVICEGTPYNYRHIVEYIGNDRKAKIEIDLDSLPNWLVDELDDYESEGLSLIEWGELNHRCEYVANNYKDILQGEIDSVEKEIRNKQDYLKGLKTKIIEVRNHE